MSSKIVALAVTAGYAFAPAAQATIASYAEYHLGEAGSLGANKLPLDGSGNGRNLTNTINGGSASVGSAAFHSLAANSTAYLDTSPTGNEGFYGSNLFTSLPTDNFAFGVFARAASNTSTTQGDIFTLGGSAGSFKLSLAGNGWAASAHNVAWIGTGDGVSGSFAADTWVHLALVRSAGITTFYINGVAQGTTHSGAPAHDTPHISVNSGAGAFFDGQIDEARVITFDTGDTATDILAALQVGSRIPDYFVNEGIKGAYRAADLSTDQYSSFRLGGGTNDFVKITLADRLSVIAGSAPTQVIDIFKQGTIVTGTYPLIDYTGTIGGLGFAGLSLGNLPPRVTATLVNNPTNTTIDLDVTAVGEDNITWTGVGGIWDLETTVAWKFNTGGASTVFYDADHVTFDDTATTGAVNISDSVQPATLAVNNPTLDYTFSGDSITGTTGLVKSGAAGLTVSNFNTFSGGATLSDGTVRLEGANGSLGTGTITNNAALIVERSATSALSNTISGTGTLEKRGGETLTLGGPNTYSGTTTITAGTLKSGNAACLGAASGNTTVAAGATLDVNSTGFGSEPITINGSGVGGAGAIVNSGSLMLNAVLKLTLASDAAIGGTGRWDVRGSGATASGNFKLTKVGTNHTSMVSTTVDLKDIDIQQGSVAFEFGTVYADTNLGRVAVATGSTIGFGDHGSAITVSKPLQMDGGMIRTTGTGSNGTCIVISPVTLNAASTQILVDSSATMNLNGIFSGTGGIEKTGDGTLSLGATNAYTGDTTVTLGTLRLATDSLANGSTVSVASGATIDLTHAATDTVHALFIGGVQQSPGLYKSATGVGAGAVLAELAGTGKLQVATGPANTFAAWMAGYDFSAFPGADLSATGDADNDGIINLIEQVLGTAPNAATSGLTPVSATATSVTFTHRLNPDPASDVSYSYQWSTDLGEWKASGESDSGGTTAAIVAGAPVADVVTVTATISAGPATRIFVRLTAVQAP